MLIVFAVIQFGILFNNYVALTDAVRAGARSARCPGSPGPRRRLPTTKVKAATGDWIQQVGVAVSVPPGWTHGDDVKVSATYPYSINLLGLVVKSGNLTSTTTERVE